MMNSQVVEVGARAVDVGYFNTKNTLGRKEAGQSVEITVGMFPSLAPRLASNVMMHSPGTSTADGTVVSIGGMRYFVGRGAVFNSTGMEYCSHIQRHYLKLAKPIHMKDNPVIANVRGFQMVGESMMDQMLRRAA